MKRLMVFSDYLPIQQTRMFSSKFQSNYIRLFLLLTLVISTGVLKSQSECEVNYFMTSAGFGCEERTGNL